MALEIGSRLGHYEVTALIGEGGMGQVYSATDTKLNRQVALKILPEAFATDPDRLARFQREAQVLASLNHPGIAAIHGIEESDGQQALVLELVEGPTLADRIAKGPIPLDEALPIAKQIAEALEAAHEAGVIHRDLKPANIKVRNDGTVKVLDFGLAKALDPTPEGDPSQSPTMTGSATQMGVIMGTAAYMSPEQAAGKPVDKRSDIWSFGVVLFEMLAGEQLFEGEMVAHIMAKVLDRELDFSALPVATPTLVRRLLHRCLRREPKGRLRDLGEALSLLEDAAIEPRREVSISGPVTTSIRRQMFPWVAGIAVGGVVATLALWNSSGRDVAVPSVKALTIQLPSTTPLVFRGSRPALDLSPDGSTLAYVGTRDGIDQIYRRLMRDAEPVPIEGTERGYAPFFSPDGSWIGFVADGTLQKVRLVGGPAVPLCCDSPTITPGRGSWGADDTIVFHNPNTYASRRQEAVSGQLTAGSGMLRVPVAGGNPDQATVQQAEAGETDHKWAEFLPDGKAVLFTVWYGSFETAHIAVRSLETGERKDLVAGSNPRFVSTGHLVFARPDGSLWAVPFDEDRLELTGDPVPVLEGVSVGSFGAAQFAVANDGTLVYLPATEVEAGQPQLAWVDRRGGTTPLTLALEPSVARARLSPDGTLLAVEADGSIWVHDVARGTRTRLTFDGTNTHPVWTPDGNWVTFLSRRPESTSAVYRVPADGSGQPEPLSDIQDDAPHTRMYPYSWSPDGRLLAYYNDVPRDIWVLPLEGDRSPVPFATTDFNERSPAFSPDGRWLAYVSDETGRDEVYVQPYPGPGRRVVVSTEGGREPVWSRTGQELFYRSSNVVMAAEVNTGSTLEVGSQQELFEWTPSADDPAGGTRSFDVSADGQRFLMEIERTARTQINVVLNWHQVLRDRVGRN